MHLHITPNAPPVIQLVEVSKTFPLPDGNNFNAIKSLSLDIAAGQVFGLIGKSGAGKSTLLRLINLLERPDTGQVLLDGHDLTKVSKRQWRVGRQGRGMIFQQCN